MQAFHYLQILLIKFNQDWPIGFRHILFKSVDDDNGGWQYYKFSLWYFGLAEPKNKHFYFKDYSVKC